MRILVPLILAAFAAPAAVQAAEPPEAAFCYDVAVQGSLREVTFLDSDDIGFVTTRQLAIDVSKTYGGQRAPDRIAVLMSSHSEPNPSRFKEALFFLSRDEGGYRLLSFAIDTPRDGRGLLSRGQIEALAREAGLKRCRA